MLKNEFSSSMENKSGYNTFNNELIKSNFINKNKFDFKFEDLVSVDGAKLKSAFNININRENLIQIKTFKNQNKKYWRYDINIELSQVINKKL